MSINITVRNFIDKKGKEDMVWVNHNIRPYSQKQLKEKGIELEIDYNKISQEIEFGLISRIYNKIKYYVIKNIREITGKKRIKEGFSFEVKVGDKTFEGKTKKCGFDFDAEKMFYESSIEDLQKLKLKIEDREIEIDVEENFNIKKGQEEQLARIKKIEENFKEYGLNFYGFSFNPKEIHEIHINNFEIPWEISFNNLNKQDKKFCLLQSGRIDFARGLKVEDLEVAKEKISKLQSLIKELKEEYPNMVYLGE